MIIEQEKMLSDRKAYIYCYLYILFPLSIVGNQEFHAINEETRLIRMLLNEKDYLKKVRPSHTVIVDIRLVFNQIVSMVEKEQIIVTNCFVDQKWTGDYKQSSVFFPRIIKFFYRLDSRLVWDPLNFGNITWIRMPATSVWYEIKILYFKFSFVLGIRIRFYITRLIMLVFSFHKIHRMSL
jgi:hypothetical protein